MFWKRPRGSGNRFPALATAYARPCPASVRRLLTAIRGGRGGWAPRLAAATGGQWQANFAWAKQGRIVSAVRSCGACLAGFHEGRAPLDQCLCCSAAVGVVWYWQGGWAIAVVRGCRVGSHAEHPAALGEAQAANLAPDGRGGENTAQPPDARATERGTGSAIAREPMPR